jgi:hypothetical protein
VVCRIPYLDLCLSQLAVFRSGTSSLPAHEAQTRGLTVKNTSSGLLAFFFVVIGGIAAFVAIQMLRGQSLSEPWKEVRSNVDIKPIDFPSPVKFGGGGGEKSFP